MVQKRKNGESEASTYQLKAKAGSEAGASSQVSKTREWLRGGLHPE